jgi:hypothetical protein
VSLTWIYLVAFQNKSSPERQEIEVEINTSVPPNRLRRVDLKRDTVGSRVIEFDDPVDVIRYRISFTARTWGGADIENLLIDHISSLIIPERRWFRRIVQRWRNFTWNIFALSLFSLFVLAALAAANWIGSVREAAYKGLDLASSDSLQRLGSKIDYIAANQVYFGASAINIGIIVFLILGLSVSYIVSGIMTDELKRHRPSFVIFTRRSEINMQHVIEIYENDWRRFIWFFVCSVVAGVAGNLLTVFMIK